MSLLDVYFQSVHEPTGPSEGYLQLEELVKQVVSPFLGISEDRGVSGPAFMLGKGQGSRAAGCFGDNAASSVFLSLDYVQAPGF